MTAVARQMQWYRAIIHFGATLGYLPVLPGISLNVNENFAVPPIMSNYWSFSVGQGFINPTLNCSIVFRDSATELLKPSGAAGSPANFWDFAHMRSNDGAHDAYTLGDITIQQPDGSGFILRNAKIADYSLSCSKAGGDINVSASFVGTSVDPLGTPLVFPGWSNANVVRFKNVQFAPPLDNQVFEFGCSYSNQMSPNMALNGSEFPAEQNAGMQSANFNMSTQIGTQNRPDNGTFPPPATLATIQFSIAGSAHTGVWTAANPINNTRRSRNFSPPRLMQQSQYILLGGDSETLPPLSVVVS